MLDWCLVSCSLSRMEKGHGSRRGWSPWTHHHIVMFILYRMEASNIGLDGSLNSLKLVDYGDDSTLVNWSFEINPIEGACKDSIIDYLGFLYKSSINRIESAIEAAFKQG